MRVVGTAAWVCLLSVVGCATGTVAGDNTATDSGTNKDASTLPDSGGVKQDSGGTKDTGGPPPPQDSGGGNCGGQCLGVNSTCCSNTCVDIVTDLNNCGGCGIVCTGTQSCCSGVPTDTMGSDNANCGGCGVTCSGTCTNGTCQTNNTNCTIDMGSCSHSPCTTGGALSAGCDSTDEDIVTSICIFDINCCTSTWDSTCVGYAQLFEINSCMGGGC